MAKEIFGTAVWTSTFKTWWSHFISEFSMREHYSLTLKVGRFRWEEERERLNGSSLRHLKERPKRHHPLISLIHSLWRSATLLRALKATWFHKRAPHLWRATPLQACSTWSLRLISSYESLSMHYKWLSNCSFLSLLFLLLLVFFQH